MSCVLHHQLDAMLPGESDRSTHIARALSCDRVRGHHPLVTAHVPWSIDPAPLAFPSQTLHRAGLVGAPGGVGPVRLGLGAKFSIVVRVVTWPCSWTRSNEAPIDRGVESGPSVRGWPAWLRRYAVSANGCTRSEKEKTSSLDCSVFAVCALDPLWRKSSATRRR